MPYQAGGMPFQQGGMPNQQGFVQGMRGALAHHSDVESEGSSSEDGGKEYRGSGPISEAPSYVRSDFVRKVYSILCVQLILTLAIALPMNLYMDATAVRNNLSLYYAALAVSMGAIIGVGCCCKKAARTFPYNYIFLLVVTVSMAIMTGFTTAMYTTQSVMMALGTTAFVFGALSAFACCTKSDFTGMGPYLMCALFAMIGVSCMFSLVYAFGGAVPSWLHTLLALGGAVLFSFYIVYDTQLILGQGKHSISIDDYVFAALNLYLDVINLFLYILQLFGDRR
eukprot:TRINITY_DN11610_c0_g1_i2.p1 TRINITY_DN11610_c0_g1~~TRINITY_DN11610_c0_g1_i2.p1  ORF type:complete len:314 (+),score=49.95 TRINITY_DN11610_c0_g1_i2:98-943(+)